MLVAATDHIVVHEQAGTTQLGQNAVGNLGVHAAHVANLLLTLFGILIHGEDAQNHLLVLKVALADQLLEAVPVLSGVLGVHVGLHANLLKLALEEFVGNILTLFGQLLVEVVLTVGRSVSAHLDALESAGLVVVIDLLQNLHEILDAHAAGLAGAEVSLVDEELDVGLLLLPDDALEGVGSG